MFNHPNIPSLTLDIPATTSSIPLRSLLLEVVEEDLLGSLVSSGETSAFCSSDTSSISFYGTSSCSSEVSGGGGTPGFISLTITLGFSEIDIMEEDEVFFVEEASPKVSVEGPMTPTPVPRTEKFF